MEERSFGVTKHADDDSPSLAVSRNVGRSQDRAQAGSMLETKKQEGGTQINQASIAGILPPNESADARQVPN